MTDGEIVPPILHGREQFRKVDTGNGIDRDLAATTNDRLELTVIELQKLQKNNTQQTKRLGALLGNLDDSIVYLQGDIKLLINTIKDANIKNDKMQRWFFLIGFIGTVFTALSVIQVIDILIRGIGK
jgi:hypothetical protein